MIICVFRAVRRSKNPGVPVLFCQFVVCTLVEIGLTDLPKPGGAMAPPGNPGDDTPASYILNASHDRIRDCDKASIFLE